MSTREREIAKLVEQYKLLEDTAKQFDRQLIILENIRSELTAAIEAIKGLKDQEGTFEALIPIGGGIYIPSTLEKPNRAIVNLGAGVYLEESIEEALEYLSEKRLEVEGQIRKINIYLQRIVEEMNRIVATLSKLSKEV